MLYKTNQSVLIDSDEVIIFDPVLKEEKCIIKNMRIGSWSLFKTFKEEKENLIESLVFSNNESNKDLNLKLFKFVSIILIDSKKFILCDKSFFNEDKNKDKKNLFVKYYEEAFENKAKSKLSKHIDIADKHTITAFTNETTQSISIEVFKSDKKIDAIKVNLN